MTTIAWPHHRTAKFGQHLPVHQRWLASRRRLRFPQIPAAPPTSSSAARGLTQTTKTSPTSRSPISLRPARLRNKNENAPPSPPPPFFPPGRKGVWKIDLFGPRGGPRAGKPKLGQ